MDTKKLSDEEKMTLDIKQLTKSELYEALKTFPKNKTPGSDGLTVEFYLAFWHVVAKYLEKSLNFSHQHMGSCSTHERKKGRE